MEAALTQRNAEAEAAAAEAEAVVAEAAAEAAAAAAAAGVVEVALGQPGKLGLRWGKVPAGCMITSVHVEGQAAATGLRVGHVLEAVTGPAGRPVDVRGMR